jgi:hypothetical protein
MTMTRTAAMRATAVLLGSFLASVAVDRGVGLFMAPIPPPQVAHPPNFKQLRSSPEFSYEFKTNSMGLRYREIALAKTTPIEFRAFVVGDSYVEGWGVSDAQRYTERLEQAFSTATRPALFINGGLSATAPIQYARMLFMAGLRYHPDLALVVIYANDLLAIPPDASLDVTEDRGTFLLAPRRLLWPPSSGVRKVAETVWPWAYARLQYLTFARDSARYFSLRFMDQIDERAKRNGVSEEAVRAWKSHLPADVLEAYENPAYTSVQTDSLAKGLFQPDFWIDSLDLTTEADQAHWSGMARVLTEIVQDCAKVKLPVAFIYAPFELQYDWTKAGFWQAAGVNVRQAWLTEHAELEQRLEGWAEQRGVPYLSLTPPLRMFAHEVPGTLTFKRDEHLTPRGHMLAAAVIADWLRARHLVPAER